MLSSKAHRVYMQNPCQPCKMARRTANRKTDSPVTKPLKNENHDKNVTVEKTKTGTWRHMARPTTVTKPRQNVSIKNDTARRTPSKHHDIHGRTKIGTSYLDGVQKVGQRSDTLSTWVQVVTFCQKLGCITFDSACDKGCIIFDTVDRGAC